MQLTLERRTDIALRVVRSLAAAEGRLLGRDLARELEVTAQYLPKVLRPLVHAGWIESRPGPAGGYRLVVRPTDHSLLDLIELVEGPTTPAPCVLRPGPCESADRCALHDPWQRARTALLDELAAAPVAAPPTA